MEAVLTRFIWILPAVLLASAARPLAAQEVRDQPMPTSFTPPAGLCRVWIAGVPASQQPAPTDCASAIKNRPSNAAVVFGPKRRGETNELEPFTHRAKLPLARQFAPNSLAGRPREQPRDQVREPVRDRTGDSVPKPPARKPEKPQ